MLQAIDPKLRGGQPADAVEMGDRLQSMSVRRANALGELGLSKVRVELVILHSETGLAGRVGIPFRRGPRIGVHAAREGRRFVDRPGVHGLRTEPGPGGDHPVVTSVGDRIAAGVSHGGHAPREGDKGVVARDPVVAFRRDDRFAVTEIDLLDPGRRDVGMGVDEARQHEPTAEVMPVQPSRRRRPRAATEGGDPAVLHQDPGVLDAEARRWVDQCDVLIDVGSWRGGRCAGDSCEKQDRPGRRKDPAKHQSPPGLCHQQSSAWRRAHPYRSARISCVALRRPFGRDVGLLQFTEQP